MESQVIRNENFLAANKVAQTKMKWMAEMEEKRKAIYPHLPVVLSLPTAKLKSRAER